MVQMKITSQSCTLSWRRTLTAVCCCCCCWLQMKIIKEHGPPVFDASEAASHDMLAAMQQQRPCSTDYSGASQSGVSGSAPTATATTHSSLSDTDGEDAPEGGPGAADGLSKSLSGVSHTSTASGSAAAAAAGVSQPGTAVVKGEPVDREAEVTAAAAAGGKDDDEEEDCGGLPCCDAPQMCSPAQQKRTISTLKHMNTGARSRPWSGCFKQCDCCCVAAGVRCALRVWLPGSAFGRTSLLFADEMIKHWQQFVHATALS
jgi:hypothetical protein